MLGVALPVWRTAVQREREAELVFRGEQYANAIAIFQRRTGGYPPSLDVLEKTRAIRKLYKDPMTGGDFQPVFVGQMIGGAPVAPGQQGPGAGQRGRLDCVPRLSPRPDAGARGAAQVRLRRGRGQTVLGTGQPYPCRRTDLGSSAAAPPLPAPLQRPRQVQRVGVCRDGGGPAGRHTDGGETRECRAGWPPGPRGHNRTACARPARALAVRRELPFLAEVSAARPRRGGFPGAQPVSRCFQGWGDPHLRRSNSRSGPIRASPHRVPPVDLLVASFARDGARVRQQHV